MKGFGRQSTVESLDSGSKHAGRVFGNYSIGSEEDPGESSKRETMDDTDEYSISTSRTSLTDADDDNICAKSTPTSGNLAGRTQHRTSSHQSAGIELSMMTNKTKGKDGFNPMLMSQDTFDAQSQGNRPTSLRTTTTTTKNTGGDMDISAPTLLARASATGALNGANVNFVEGLDEYDAQRKMDSMQRVQQSRAKGGISSKDFLMATRSR